VCYLSIQTHRAAPAIGPLYKMKTPLRLIDGAPQAADLAVSAIKAASFILIPVQPSPYDIWATADLVELVKQRIEVTDGKLQAAFVVSRAIKGTRIGAEITEALAGYGLPVLNSRITQRVSYPGTAAAGTTILDAEPDGDGAGEIRALMNEIKQKLV
jgi:chromosome partitioning protein